MTGIAGNGSTLFVSGKDDFAANATHRIYRCTPLPLVNQTVQIDEYLSLAAYGTIRDIAYEGISNTRTDGDMWIACDDRENPLKALNSSGQLVDQVPASIGIGRDLWGLAYEKGTSRFLWVSNQTNNRIYKVDFDGTTRMYPNKNRGVNFSDNVKIKDTKEFIALYIPFIRNCQVTVYDIKGKAYTSFTAKGNRWHTIAKSFSPGIYFLKFTSSEQTFINRYQFVR